MSDWFVYIIRCADDSLYTGISTNVASRIISHNAGDGAKYTRGRRPVSLVWFEKANSESSARKRELHIKSWTRREKEDLVKGD